MGVLLGLAAALSWGISDFLARFATHKVGAYRTTFYMQMTGLVSLSLCLPGLGGWGHLADGSGWEPWTWGVLAGGLNLASTLSLYRSFEIGKLAMVAPISASYPVLTVLMAIGSGERLTAMRMGGIATTVIGVILVAAGGKEGKNINGVKEKNGEWPRGVGWAVASAVGFGVLFWLLGVRVVPRVGSAAAVWMIRLTSFSAVGLLSLPLRLPLRMPWGGMWVRVAIMGALDSAAFVANNYGMRTEQVSVVSVLASLYGAVTVALAAAVLREKLAARQWVGIVLIFAGIALVSR